LFIEDFVGSISSPAKKDGREHIDYVPSQVVSEFFAKAFRRASGEAIHGMVYPSAVKPGGRNVVLFPQLDDQRALIVGEFGGVGPLDWMTSQLRSTTSFEL
jgi:RES domain-containing protein